jgi:hypothetical protein
MAVPCELVHAPCFLLLVRLYGYTSTSRTYMPHFATCDQFLVDADELIAAAPKILSSIVQPHLNLAEPGT